MTTSITADKVREITGATDSLIGDTEIESIISTADNRVNSKFSIKTTPTRNIDMVQVVDSNYVETNKNPLLSIIKLKHNNYDVDITNLTFNSLGTIRQDYRRFVNRTGLFKRNNIVYVEYLYGWVEEKDYKEQTTMALTAGSSVEIVVADDTQYAVDDYIRIKGFDGSVDIAQVTASTTNKITVDTLIYNHEIGSLIEILQTPSIVDDWVLYTAAANVCNYIVGNSSKLATGYSRPEYNVQKGQPYVHWRDSRDKYQATADSISDDINGKLIM